MPHNSIRLAVVGDQGVGKTSLVCAIISDLPTDIPKIHKKVVLPPDMCPYSKDIFTQVVDTGSDPRNQIKLCDLVLLVYDVSDEDSIMRLNQHWLPIINTLTKEKSHPTPVVIVGNKSDKFELPVDQEKDHTTVKEVLKGLTKGFKQVQMGIECSAKYDRNIKKVLNSAQRAVLYPLAPLYDLSQKTITPKFRKALIRIFRILDTQCSGVLSDRQLSTLQERVFQTELSMQDIRAIKNIIQKECHEQQANSITIKGFITFQKKCIQMLKIQICWNILKYFNYNHELEIRGDRDGFAIKVEDGQGLELSNDAINFLQKIYMYASKSFEEDEVMMKLFEPAPDLPIPQFAAKNISLERFIYLWHLLSILDYRKCYQSLLYIGYDHKLQQCFTITPHKKKYSNLLKIKQRSTYNILIVENKYHAALYGQLFAQAVEEQGITRNVTVYSGEKESKVVNLFLVAERHFENFMRNNQLALKVDLVVYFESQQLSPRQVNDCLPEHIMRQQLSQKLTEQLSVPSMDYHSIPVKIKESPSQKLLKHLVSIFHNIDTAYPSNYIIALKQEESRVKKIFFGIASGLVVATIGFLTFQNKKNK